MRVKIKSEQLRYIKFHRAKLRSNINLCDAIVGNVDEKLISTSHQVPEYIRPSSYIGSPRRVQEYIQDFRARVQPTSDLFMDIYVPSKLG